MIRAIVTSETCVEKIDKVVLDKGKQFLQDEIWNAVWPWSLVWLHIANRCAYFIQRN